MEREKIEVAGSSKQELEMKGEERVFDEEDDDDDHQESKEVFGNFVPGPLLPLKVQIEKDKEDESLRRWKEKLLGGLDSDLNGNVEPEVKFHSIGIISSDFGEISTPFPICEEQSKQIHFTLHEGSEYQLKLTFSVLHNIVSGLAYTNSVWKGGIQVDQSRGMLGTFAPQKAPYVHTLEEETTPSGVLARGVYAAKLKFEDDDKRRHVELNYSFEIQRRH
ncbi:rho GDP-dissociation inhibitor 1-like [Salvia miltiorrhiza]|uniref:rho GDP-dissociation inhibitor 1-like n=1 Tax=Salvia miltiorrhiza TaxID=226208 RepID=UPI0025ACB6DA|nr:rho GDP-dissociation inhibitor 1-like [Salvia miltiorrhiza]